MEKYLGGRNRRCSRILSICNFNYLEGSPCVFGRAELASAMCSGCWDYVTSLFKKEQRQCGCWLHSHCCLFPHQFWTGSKICSSGSSVTSRLYCWYFVTLARLLLLPYYYPYKKQTILYIAADHDLILFRIYIYIALAVGFLRVMMGYFQVGTNASGMAQPCPYLPIPGILGTENQFT